jgi:hypothetical protein
MHMSSDKVLPPRGAGMRTAWIAARIGIIPSQASAHVKWFCSVADVVQPPVPLGRVLTPVFGAVCCVFLLLVFAGLLLDGAAARCCPRLASSGRLAFGLMWTAVEKFVFPQWTLDVVAQHPDLAFGFPRGFTVVVAGFVEFTLAFYVMTSRGLVRFGAAAFAAIFIAAIPEFDHLDAVGPHADHRDPCRGVHAPRRAAAAPAERGEPGTDSQRGGSLVALFDVADRLLRDVLRAALGGIRLRRLA